MKHFCPSRIKYFRYSDVKNISERNNFKITLPLNLSKIGHSKINYIIYKTGIHNVISRNHAMGYDDLYRSTNEGKLVKLFSTAVSKSLTRYIFSSFQQNRRWNEQVTKSLRLKRTNRHIDSRESLPRNV